MADLMDEKERRVVARYVYRGDDGRELYTKVRFEPKFFNWVHVNGNGETLGRGEHPPVLYRLPELSAAISRGETVYVVEGEKDADRLAEIGVAATSNPNGAADKWRPEYTPYFTGADVVIIADRDEPGYAHAANVRAALAGVARRVTVMQSAAVFPGADVSDHLDAGYSIDDLVPAVTGTGFRPVSLAGLVKDGVAAPSFAGDMLYAGGLHCIAGPPDSGKTSVALYWMVELLRSGARVAFFDEEGGSDIVAEKLIALGAAAGDVRNLTYVPFPGKMWDDQDVRGLMEFLGSVEPAMVLWDSSAAFLARAGLDENSAPAVTSWWSRVLTPLARDLHAAVLVIDHDTKSGEQSRYARGSGAKLAALDVQFKVEIAKPFSRDQDGMLKLTVTKDRRGYLHRDWMIRMETGSGTIRPDFYHATEDSFADAWPPARRKIYGVLDTAPCTNEHIREQIGKYFPDEGKPGITRETVSRELNALLRDGYASRIGSDGEASLWRKCR